MLLVGKALGGGVLPVSAVVATAEVFDGLNRDPQRAAFPGALCLSPEGSAGRRHLSPAPAARGAYGFRALVSTG